MLSRNPDTSSAIRTWLSAPDSISIRGFILVLNKVCIRDVMERNCIYNMKMEEFARLCGRSLTSFKRDFMITYRTTPGRWLALKRLEYARHLLETTDKNINELTFESGFENPSHFIRTFKQAFRMTPLQYKKRIIMPADNS